MGFGGVGRLRRWTEQMARYVSSAQLTLPEEIVPLDGPPELLELDGPRDGPPSATTGPAADKPELSADTEAALAVIEPTTTPGATEPPARTVGAEATGADPEPFAPAGQEAAGTERGVEGDGLEGEGDRLEAPWVDAAPKREVGPRRSLGMSAARSHARLGARALAVGVLVLVVAAIVVAAWPDGSAHRSAASHARQRAQAPRIVRPSKPARRGAA